MKIWIWCLIVFLLFAGSFLYSQNAPITTAPVIGTAVNGQQVVAPVSVQNFFDIGAFTLTLNYQTSSLTFLNATFNSVLTGLSINSSTPGKIIISWTGTTGISLPDQTQLFHVTFSYISGKSLLNWTTTGTSCQYKKFDGGLFTVLYDLPKTSYYIGGAVTDQLAPKTHVPIITNALPGIVYIPVTVDDFTGIRSLSLKFVYDANVLTYQDNFTPNPAFVGNFLVSTETLPSGEKRLIIGWYGNPVTLTDGSTLVNLKFNYSITSGNGNSSALTWYENGPSCEYTNENSITLYDKSKSDFYYDGLIANQLSPETWMPSITGAVPGSTVSVPVLVNGFTNISSLDLAIKFDPSVLTLPEGAYITNPAFGSSLQVNNLPTGPDGKRTLMIEWNGPPVTIDDGSSIVTFEFSFHSGTSLLSWRTTADSCNFSDNLGNIFWNKPQENYFRDGLIGSHLAPKTEIPVLAGIPSQTLSVPVKITEFTNIGAFHLTLLYDPGVMTYQSAVLNPFFSGTLMINSSGPGCLIMEWTGPATSLTDNSTLVDLSFGYAGGNSSLQWYYPETSCVYYEGTTMIPLFDQPETVYYTNGSVFPGKTCNLSLFLEGLYAGIISEVKTMNQAKDVVMGVNVPKWPAGVADHIIVELHSIPYATSVFHVAEVELSTTGTATVNDIAVPGGSYYITIKHRNSIEITSASPVDFSGTEINYSFDSQIKAYGSNMGVMIDGTAVIFTGDSNQDGIIDGSDMNDIGNMNDLFASGYLVEDVNGDGLVDGSDMNITGNNNNIFIMKQVP